MELVGIIQMRINLKDKVSGRMADVLLGLALKNHIIKQLLELTFKVAQRKNTKVKNFLMFWVLQNKDQHL
jgi:hypothetical protein